MKKFALISLGLPPSQSGQSIVLYHLLKGIDPADYCLITQKNFHLYHTQGNCSTLLSAPYHYLHPDYQVIRVLTAIASKIHSSVILNLILKIRVWQIKRVLTAEDARVVIACTGDLFDPAAAFLASRELNLPYVLYAFDYYSHQWTLPVTRAFAENFEKQILKGAAKIIVPNECMAAEYSRRHGVTPVIIHNPFDLAEYERYAQSSAGEPVEEEGKDSDVRIVYTGAVYDAHYSAFRNLIAAIPKTGIPGLTVHIYTPQSLSHLAAQGISGPVKIHKPRPNCDMPGIQRSADILFLPLAFNSPFPEIIRTSAPGKIGEYLASKKPVLVHAPEDSFVTWLFRKNKCGQVVSADDPDKLAEAILHLVRDEGYREELVENAYNLAVKDFDAVSARKRLGSLVDSLARKSR